ncbi:MAG: CYTH and CHAD domain-containing protein [Actinomycetota bacterium]|nr:CYTH and CHAD domain-containing protein [Actinomycetota bacterium]
MATTYLEREDKFDVEPAFVVPDVTSLLPPGGHIELITDKLRSRYFDTEDHDLMRAEMTLRRRTGDTDSGWQLKVPHQPAREEIRLTRKSTTVPKELERLLYGVTRGQTLKQVATILTERTLHRLFDAGGNLLAEIADDNVEASTGGAQATILRWREIEVELGEGDEDSLAALGKRLRKAGAVRASSASKLGRALSAAPRTESAHAERPAATPVLGYLEEQQRVLLAGDLALRRDQDEVIHKTRVATRRLRSTLRTFGSLFDAEPAAELDNELKWFAGLLGAVRDIQVQRGRLDRLIDELPEENVLGPVVARIHTELGQDQAEAWQRLQVELTGPRYVALLNSVAAWIRNPPLTPTADSKPAVLAKMVDKAVRKVRRRLTQATDSADVDLLHSARKAAKRARYAAELTEPVTGKAAHKLVTRYKHLQELLGDHQDSLVSADLLRRLGAKAGTFPGENGFTFGLLYQRVSEEAANLRVQATHEATKHS